MNQPRPEIMSVNPVVTAVTQPKTETTIQTQVMAQTNTINVSFASTTEAGKTEAAQPQKMSDVENSVKIEKPL